MSVHSFRLAPLISVLFLGGCAYDGGDIGNPINRKVAWFSFVEGEDIKKTCQVGGPDRVRLVYNANYTDQVRVYETDAVTRLLTVRVYGNGNVAKMTLDDLLSPWRAKVEKVQLDQTVYAGLDQSLTQSGAFGPAAVGLELPSRSYYWTAASCHQGRYAFTAWKYPSDAFATLSFPPILFGQDTTKVPVQDARDIPFDPLWDTKARRGEVVSFSLSVGPDGLMH